MTRWIARVISRMSWELLRVVVRQLIRHGVLHVAWPHI